MASLEPMGIARSGGRSAAVTRGGLRLSLGDDSSPKVHTINPLLTLDSYLDMEESKQAHYPVGIMHLRSTKNSLRYALYRHCPHPRIITGVGADRL